MQDALGRLTCLEVHPIACLCLPSSLFLKFRLARMCILKKIIIWLRVQLSSEKNGYGSTTACSMTSTI